MTIFLRSLRKLWLWRLDCCFRGNLRMSTPKVTEIVLTNLRLEHRTSGKVINIALMKPVTKANGFGNTT